MKHIYVLMVASLGLLAACSDLNEIGFIEKVIIDGDLVEKVIFEAPVIRALGDDDETRASLFQEGEGSIRFAWEATDTVGIFPDKGSQVFFEMTNGAGSNVASFDGGGWSLKQKSTYSCYYPLVGDFYLDRNAIPVSFDNQVQAGVSDYSGISFYLASEGTSSESGALRFSFKMLNTVIRVKAIGLPAGKYTKLTLTTDEDLFVKEGTFGLEDMVITGKTYYNTLEIALNDFTLTETSTEANPVLVYLTSSPVDLSGKKVTIRMYSSDGSVYTCEKTPGKAYEAGAWGGLKCEMEQEGQLPKNVIYYTSSHGNIVAPYKTDVFGANIVSNEYVNGKGLITFDGDVTSIGSSAFYGKNTLTSISIPESVKSIGSSAFHGCSSLTSVTIPEGVTSIEYSTFRDCSSLTSVIIPESITRINDYAFHNCSSLNAINLPTNLESLGYAVFCASTLTCITIPESVTSVGEASFTINTLVSFKGKYASSDGLFLIDSGTVYGAAWGAIDGNVIIPDGITRIGNDTFWGCPNLSDLYLPDGLISIGGAAFRDCKKMTSLIIPESVTSIGEFAFDQCSGLTSITVLPMDPPTLGQSVFQSTGNCPIYVPAVSVDSYKTSIYWRSYADRIQALPSPASVTEISLDPSSLSLSVGTSKTLTATVLPENAANKNVSWSSSDESVATVDAYGNVVAISFGSASIMATTEDGGFTATCEVTVDKPFPEGNAFEEDAFITYVSNHQEWFNMSTDRTYVYDTNFSTNVSGTRLEMKFQIPDYSSKKAILSYGSSVGLAIDVSNVYYYYDKRYHEDGDTWYDRDYLSGVESVNGTGVVVLNASCDGDHITVSVKGEETTIPKSVSSLSIQYLFSYYDSESGDGSLYRYLAGVPDGAKLYYVKIWDGDDLLYFGHASRATYSVTKQEEYCWYEEIGNKYTFARSLHTLTSSEITPYNPSSPIATVRQPFGGGMD